MLDMPRLIVPRTEPRCARVLYTPDIFITITIAVLVMLVKPKKKTEQVKKAEAKRYGRAIMSTFHISFIQADAWFIFYKR